MTKEWEYYLTNWQGKEEARKDEFEQNWDLAMRYINKHTFGKACPEDQAVMKCACALVDCLGKYAKSASPEIASESLDNFGTSYRTAEEITKQRNAEIAEIIGLYLPQELLYRGLV